MTIRRLKMDSVQPAKRVPGSRRAATMLALCLTLGVLPAAAQQSLPAEQGPVDRAAMQDGSAPTEEPERPRLSDGAELDRIIELYMAGDYSSCARDLRSLLQREHPEGFSDPSIAERGRLYYSTCALLQGDRETARAALRAALEENPLMASPDSLTFPPPLVSLFLEVRDEVQQLVADREKEQILRLRRENELARRRAELRRERERKLEELAAQESVVAKNSRVIAALPYGAGQFQNGNDSLGAFFLISEGVLTLSAATSGFILEGIISKKERSDRQPDKQRYDNQTQALYQTMKWSFWGLVSVYATGVLEAQLRFKSERRLAARPRPLPPPVDEEEDAESLDDAPEDFSPEVQPGDPSSRRVPIEIHPTAAILPGGGFFGFSGRF